MAPQNCATIFPKSKVSHGGEYPESQLKQIKDRKMIIAQQLWINQINRLHFKSVTITKQRKIYKSTFMTDGGKTVSVFVLNTSADTLEFF